MAATYDPHGIAVRHPATAAPQVHSRRMTPGELIRVGRDLQAARTKLEAAMHRAAEWAEQAHAGGMPETEIARLLGVNRLTVRRWLGKG